MVELNHLELQFLLLNDFRLSVPVEELEAYGTMLVGGFRASHALHCFADSVNSKGRILRARVCWKSKATGRSSRGRIVHVSIDAIIGTTDHEIRAFTRLLH